MPTTEKQIHARFLAVLSDHVGLGKRFRYKIGFAKAIGMLPQELHRIEKGEGELQYRHIVALHRKLGVDLNWFIAGTLPGEKLSDKRVQKIRNTIKELAEKI